jgi:hypothetical protein
LSARLERVKINQCKTSTVERREEKSVAGIIGKVRIQENMTRGEVFFGKDAELTYISLGN